MNKYYTETKNVAHWDTQHIYAQLTSLNKLLQKFIARITIGPNDSRHRWKTFTSCCDRSPDNKNRSYDGTNKIKNLDNKYDACISGKLYTRIVLSSQNCCCLMHPTNMYTVNNMHVCTNYQLTRVRHSAVAVHVPYKLWACERAYIHYATSA